MLKHFLLGVGLHNITGSKTPIKILLNLGHCINNHLVCEVERAEAEVALKCIEDGHGIQPLQPLNENASVLTFWWADNFNQTFETQFGMGKINLTHIVEFSERSENTCSSMLRRSVPRNGRRSLQAVGPQISTTVKVGKEKELIIADSDMSLQAIVKTETEVNNFIWLYFLWKLL